MPTPISELFSLFSASLF